jgi:hypothetical protein
VDDAAALEVAEDASTGDLERIGHGGGRKVRERAEHQAPARRVDVDPIEEDDVQVRVECRRGSSTASAWGERRDGRLELYTRHDRPQSRATRRPQTTTRTAHFCARRRLTELRDLTFQPVARSCAILHPAAGDILPARGLGAKLRA